MILHHCSTVMTQGRLKVFMTAVRSVNYFVNYFYFGEGERRKAGRKEGEKERGSKRERKRERKTRKETSGISWVIKHDTKLSGLQNILNKLVSQHFLDLSWKWEWSHENITTTCRNYFVLPPLTLSIIKNPVNHVAFGWFFGPRRIAHKTADRQQLQLCSPQVIRYKVKQNIFGLQRTKSV